MSLELHVFLKDTHVPTRDAWQQAIEQAAFPTILDPALDLRSDTGFAPATYNDQPTGYEFDLGSAADILETYPHLAQLVGNRDMCATFHWGGDLTECAAAISSAAALTHLADGIYFFPDDDTIRTAEDVLEASREELDAL